MSVDLSPIAADLGTPDQGPHQPPKFGQASVVLLPAAADAARGMLADGRYPGW